MSSTEKTHLSQELNVDQSGEQGRSSGVIQRIMPTGGLLATCLTFSAATMGAGTLGLPNAMLATGSIWGSILLVLVCASTIFSFRLLVIILEKTNYMTYEKMAHGILGPWFGRLTGFLIVMFGWGATMLYVVAIKDIMHKLSGASWFPQVLSGHQGGQLLAIVYWACFMLPLSMLQEINSLRYASTLGVGSTLFLLCALLVHAVSDGHRNPNMVKENLTFFTFNMDMVAALPTFLFCYACQPNVYEIYTEMKPRTVKQMTKNATISMIFCTVVYIVVGTVGYANFGTKTDGNILNNLDPLSSGYLAVAFVGVTIILTATFPLNIFPTRDAILQGMGFASAYETPTYIRILVCFSLSFGSLAFGLYIPGIQVLFGVLGGICGSTLAFIWPALFYMKGVEGGFSVGNVGIGNFIATWLLLIVGVISGVLGTAVSVYQTATA